MRVLEFSAIGPTPLAAKFFSDFGADVLRVLNPRQDQRDDYVHSGRPAVSLDLKSADGTSVARRLVGRADVLLEGSRPRVMERLGLGPEACLAQNPRLIYARMTGWGQTGPYALTAGHDINYIAISGALHAIGGRGMPPTPPINLLGDFGGGTMMMIAGVLLALLERSSSGRGQVVDAAMIDGVSFLMTSVWDKYRRGQWNDARGTNLTDTGAPFYGVYETRDHRYVAVGSIEPKFYASLIDVLGLTDVNPAGQYDEAAWPELRRRFAEVFATKTRDAWQEAFRGSDACVSPVLSLAEVSSDSHVAERGTMSADRRSHPMPAPAPRLDRTPGVARHDLARRMTPQEALDSWPADDGVVTE